LLALAEQFFADGGLLRTANERPFLFEQAAGERFQFGAGVFALVLPNVLNFGKPRILFDEMKALVGQLAGQAVKVVAAALPGVGLRSNLFDFGSDGLIGFGGVSQDDDLAFGRGLIERLRDARRLSRGRVGELPAPGARPGNKAGDFLRLLMHALALMDDAGIEAVHLLLQRIELPVPGMFLLHDELPGVRQLAVAARDLAFFRLEGGVFKERRRRQPS